MPGTDTIRPSRDGDQFHYYWAARRSLQLLLPGTDLARVVVEGSGESSVGGSSEQVIDLAEYYAGTPTRVDYLQLKHSTLHADRPWTASYLKKTLIGFATRYAGLVEQGSPLAERCEFVFVTNRPAAPDVGAALADLRRGRAGNQAAKYMGAVVAGAADDRLVRDFFDRFRVDDEGPGLLRLAQLFRADVAAVLPGARGSEDVLLKEMIVRRATSLQGSTPDVTRETVLAELGVSGDELLPAPSVLDRPHTVIETAQVPDVVATITGADGVPVVVHAAGGVGKTVLAQSLAGRMPAGSVTLVYDCFAKGAYRRPSTPRHRHDQGYVQICNELAARGLCSPLVPSRIATPSDYSKAFMRRISAASEALAAVRPGALLAVVVDAADNAAMVAQAQQERTFVTDMIREEPPPNVRFVFLCRTERRHLLRPPPGCPQVRLAGFGPDETHAHVALHWDAASPKDAAELHRRTAGNPRVQALVLATAADLSQALAWLGEAPVGDQSAFDQLLTRRVAEAKDNHHGDAGEIDRLCGALAVLRPRIPVRVLAALAGCPPEFVHSFSSDLGRPLLIDGDAVQFRDEPSETWFRTRHRPSGPDLENFIGALAPLAEQDGYAATALPQLLFEAGRTDELVALALSDRGLPMGGDLERHEVARQRAHFALKAALKGNRSLDAARLAVRAGHVTAGQSRRVRLVLDSPDLAALFLDAQIVEDLVATRALASSWPGSHLHHDGALLSGAEGQTDIARSRLRSATEWMLAYVRHAHEHSQSHNVADADIAALAWGLLNTDGPDAAAGFLARWTPPDVAFRCGKPIAARLVDAGRTAELEALADSPAATKHLKLAVAEAAYDGNVLLSARTTRGLARVLVRHRKAIDVGDRGLSRGHPLLRAVLWTAVAGVRHRVLKPEQALRVLGLYLPDSLGHGAGAFHSHDTEHTLLAFAVRAALRFEPLEARNLARKELQDELGRAHVTSGEASEYLANVVPLAAVASTWATAMIGQKSADPAAVAFADALKGSDGYPTPRLLNNTAPRLAARLLSLVPDEPLSGWLSGWLDDHGPRLWRSTLINIARITAAGEGTHDLAIAAAAQARQELAAVKEDADSRCADLVRLARASLRLSPEEARSHFDHAVEIADRVGDDIYARWRTLVSAAQRAATSGPDAERCYRLSQIAEGLEPYLGDSFDPHHVMATLVALHEQQAHAIASRWRDRRVADLRSTVGALMAPAGTSLGRRARLALLAFDPPASVTDMTIAAMEHEPAWAGRTVAVIGEAHRHRALDREDFSRLRAAAAAAGAEPDGIGFSQCEQDSRSALSEPWSAPALEPPRLPRPATAPDLSTAAGWTVALAASGPRQGGMAFGEILETVRAAPPRQLEAITAAIADCPAVKLHHVDQFIRAVATKAPRPAALAGLCRRLAEAAVARHARELLTKPYEPLDLDAVAEITGQPAKHYRQLAYDALAGSAGHLDSEECFALVGNLLLDAAPEDARVAVDDMFELFSDIAAPDSADGLFDSLPPPQAAAGDSLAGLIWSALADPLAATRWQAAHSVRLLAELGCDAELAAVVAYAVGEKSVAPYVDARLEFYEMHAKQWLQFALSRASAGHATARTLQAAEPWLRSACFGPTPHAVIRPLAARLLRELQDAGMAELTPQEHAQLDGAGQPRSVELRPRQWHPRHWRPGEDSTRFRFFFDFEEHWCAPLADVFGLPAEQVLAVADRRVRATWGTRLSGERDDARRALGLYQSDKTYVHKSSWPDEDDLRFYVAVHALHQAADELLESATVLQDPDDEEDPYTSWLRSMALTRRDGRWLSDLRDRPPPAPAQRTVGRAAPASERWPFDVRPEDLEAAAFPEPDTVTVWAEEDERGYSHSCTVSVRSALVPSPLAPALLRAMQTAASPHDYAFPGQDRGRSGDSGADAFRIDDWVEGDHLPEGLDAKDPLAKGMAWPPPRPAPSYARALGLTPDPDLHEWRTAGGQVVARARSWDTMDLRSEVGDSGRRLTITWSFIADALRTLDRSLILQVAIRRRVEERRLATRSDDDQFPYLTPYFRIYLVNASGKPRQL